MKFHRQTISITIVILLALMVVGFNVSLLYMYDKARNSLDGSLGDRLLSIARAVSLEIDPDVESDLQLGELSLSTMTRFDSYFNQVSAADELSGMYLLDPEGHDLLAWEDSLSMIEVYLPLYQDAFNKARLGEASVTALYQVDSRYFKSAFYPLGADTTVAVLAIESAFGFFDTFSSFRQNMFLVDLIAVIFLVVVGAAIIFLNRKLVKAEQLLISQAALSQMGQMAAIIAHEVRNPLAIIKATAERIKKKYDVDAKDEILDFIPGEVDRLSEITRRYLQFASPASSSSEKESVNAIVTSVVDGLKREFSSKSVQLETNLPDQISEIYVESAKLRQIVINLMRNALDATHGGGIVRLEATGSVNSGEVMVSIADTGSGLGKKELSRIFDPFYTTKSQGTGLGLFVVKRLVDELGGELKVDSRVGSGTTFVIRFKGSKNG